MEEPIVTPLERHGDERGWVSEIYSGELGENLRNIHLGTMEPGVVRGNHRHERTREWITFLDTPIAVRWGEPGTTDETVLEEPSTVELPVGLPHAFKNTGSNTVSFAAYTNTLYEEDNPDVVSAELYEVTGNK